MTVSATPAGQGDLDHLPAYDPHANGLATYSLACELARGGHPGLREWFSGQSRPGSLAADAAPYPADLGRCGVAPARATTKPAHARLPGCWEVTE